MEAPWSKNNFIEKKNIFILNQVSNAEPLELKFNSLSNALRTIRSMFSLSSI